MIKTVIQVDGMMCGMCEAHANDAIRNAFDVSKVASSHTKKMCVIFSKKPLDESKLRATIEKQGYKTGKIAVSEEEKKSIFDIFKK